MRALNLRVALVLVTATSLAVAGGAGAAPSKAQSAKGDVTGGPTSFVFSAKRAAGAGPLAAKGVFEGQIVVGGTRVLRFAGPITCLDVRGASVGLFYPVDDAEPELVEMFGAGITISVTTDGRGQATSFSFLPSPMPTTTACAPMPGLAPASGPVTLKS